MRLGRIVFYLADTAFAKNMSKNVEENRHRYQNFWRWYSIDDPKKWPQWNILKPYMVSGAKMLEIGPGLRPKIPIKGGFFSILA